MAFVEKVINAASSFFSTVKGAFQGSEDPFSVVARGTKRVYREDTTERRVKPKKEAPTTETPDFVFDTHCRLPGGGQAKGKEDFASMPCSPHVDNGSQPPPEVEDRVHWWTERCLAKNNTVPMSPSSSDDGSEASGPEPEDEDLPGSQDEELPEKVYSADDLQLHEERTLAASSKKVSFGSTRRTALNPRFIDFTTQNPLTTPSDRGSLRASTSRLSAVGSGTWKSEHLGLTDWNTHKHRKRPGPFSETSSLDRRVNRMRLNQMSDRPSVGGATRTGLSNVLGGLGLQDENSRDSFGLPRKYSSADRHGTFPRQNPFAGGTMLNFGTPGITDHHPFDRQSGRLNPRRFGSQKPVPLNRRHTLAPNALRRVNRASFTEGRRRSVQNSDLRRKSMFCQKPATTGRRTWAQKMGPRSTDPRLFRDLNADPFFRDFKRQSLGPPPKPGIDTQADEDFVLASRSTSASPACVEASAPLTDKTMEQSSSTSSDASSDEESWQKRKDDGPGFHISCPKST